MEKLRVFVGFGETASHKEFKFEPKDKGKSEDKVNEDFAKAVIELSRINTEYGRFAEEKAIYNFFNSYGFKKG